MNDGDWMCCDPQCNNVNFAWRTSCNRCSKGKTEIIQKAASMPRKKLGHEIGKAAAEKSRGLFSADDWQCGRCGNVNWARRHQCNMCNAPKFGEVEERTGLGGGYNERENVEYIERDESDGEYDDFGRKKKKYRGKDEDSPRKSKPSHEKLSIETKKKTSKDEEGDEEEDDDDDADLSKYDLTGWGDDEGSIKKEAKRSRSPSFSSSSSSSKSRSSSNSSHSSRSSSPMSSDSGKLAHDKRTHSRSRSSSTERNCPKRRKISPSRKSGSRDRSESNSPASHKR